MILSSIGTCLPCCLPWRYSEQHTDIRGSEGHMACLDLPMILIVGNVVRYKFIPTFERYSVHLPGTQYFQTNSVEDWYIPYQT